MLKVLTFLFLCSVTNFPKVSSGPLKVVKDALQKEFPVKCFSSLGCFKTAAPFYDPPQRPISLLPFNLEYLNTQFHAFSKSNPKNPVTFTFQAAFLPDSVFDKNLETKFIIHGYNVQPDASSGQYLMKDALLKHGKYNVIAVNWTSGNQPPYAQAVANARVVAAQLANVINTLILSKGVQPSSVHVIGHSLGAHLAGWTGKRVKGLGRITGLDPAGPYFYDADPQARLYSGDAAFVDVIHTNGAVNYTQGLGIYENIGQINFYPNGGSSQPGCENMSVDGQIPKDYDLRASCSHSRAVLLFISSIENNGTCRFEGLSCTDYQDFATGNCTLRYQNRRSSSRPIKAVMGFYSRKPHKAVTGQKFYLSTSDSPPFCLKK